MFLPRCYCVRLKRRPPAPAALLASTQPTVFSSRPCPFNRPVRVNSNDPGEFYPSRESIWIDPLEDPRTRQPSWFKSMSPDEYSMSEPNLPGTFCASKSGGTSMEPSANPCKHGILWEAVVHRSRLEPPWNLVQTNKAVGTFLGPSACVSTEPPWNLLHIRSRSEPFRNLLNVSARKCCTSEVGQSLFR